MIAKMATKQTMSALTVTRAQLYTKKKHNYQYETDTKLETVKLG